MQEDEKLPANNPFQTCPQCGKTYPIWKLYFNTQENKWKVGHAFCQILWEDAGVVNGVWHQQIFKDICMECKMKEVVEKDYWKNMKRHFD